MTAWPLIWTVEPSNPNWEGTVGDELTFSVSAIPDPSFPDGWDYGDELNPNPLPSPPSNIQLSLVNTDLEDDEYYTIGTTNASVYVEDAGIFLPFTSIKFEKDNQVYQVQYEKDLRDFGFDFVFEFIPFPEPFDTRYIQLQATSTWTGTLNGTFIFRINNNFDAVRTSLMGITEEGEQFLSSIEDGDGTPPALEEPENNETTVETPIFGGSYVEPDEDELLETLLPKHFEVQAFRILLESAAAEQAARMTAMDGATRNAGELIKKVTLFYNKTRQAAITKELMDIVGGAEALK